MPAPAPNHIRWLCMGNSLPCTPQSWLAKWMVRAGSDLVQATLPGETHIQLHMAVQGPSIANPHADAGAASQQIQNPPRAERLSTCPTEACCPYPLPQWRAAFRHQKQTRFRMLVHEQGKGYPATGLISQPNNTATVNPARATQQQAS